MWQWFILRASYVFVFLFLTSVFVRRMKVIFLGLILGTSTSVLAVIWSVFLIGAVTGGKHFATVSDATLATWFLLAAVTFATVILFSGLAMSGAPLKNSSPAWTLRLGELSADASARDGAASWPQWVWGTPIVLLAIVITVATLYKSPPAASN